MKVGAYQFAVTESISHNLHNIKKAITDAKQKGIELIVFPECSLTGYPPHDIDNSSLLDFDELDHATADLQDMVNENLLYIIVGTITREENEYYNSAIVFVPFGEKIVYHKRALWGWDKENFKSGSNDCVFHIGEWKIGIRICFEVRFPEYFRELYQQGTDLNIILFYDIADHDDLNRYEMIKSHILTRAVENVTHTLTVDTISPYQTAPTLLCDRSGNVLSELTRNTKDMLIYELEKEKLSFGEEGRKEISDSLVAKSMLMK